MYPFLKDKNVERLPEQERKGIYRNIRAMLMHKTGNVIVSNTDNLLLSSLVGISSVSCYSNYFLIIGSVRQVLNQMFQGITASVGNLSVEESPGRVRKILEASFFAGQWVFGLAAVCLYELLDPFVEISFGSQFVFAGNVTLILCINFYLTGMRQAVLVFRDSIGLFRYDRYKALAEAVINLAVSLLLGKYMGTAGIFLGTMISTVTTSLWVEPYMLYKYHLKTSVKPYFLRYAVYAAVTWTLGWGVHSLCSRIGGNLLKVCILRLIVCAFIMNAAYLLLYCRTPEFKLLVRKARGLVNQWRSRRVPVQGPGKSGFDREESCLLEMLRDTLGNGKEVVKDRSKDSVWDWTRLVSMARYHGVLPLLYRTVEQYPFVPDWVKEDALGAARRAVMQSYRLLFLSKYLIERLEAQNIPVALLKGAATASFYREPELRKTGDVDLLLLTPVRLEEACGVLQKCGLNRKERQPALHHVVFQTGEGIEIELHTMLAEPFDNSRINRYLEEKLQECAGHVRRADLMGVELPVLDKGFHAYELLLHMLQHFLRSGFGLKLLCDWVMLWRQDTEPADRVLYLRLAEESGVRGFSDMITQVCCVYLGLPEEKVAWMDLSAGYNVREFMTEVLEAQEFGRSAADRMVVPRSTGVRGYAREFHHQMHLNFPRSGRVFLFWPVLWTVTLTRFLRNNRRIRRVSGWSILKKAGQRSRLLSEMELWK